MARRSPHRRQNGSVDLTRYRAVIPDWTQFVDAVSRPEPTVFRLRASRLIPEEVLARLESQGFVLRPLDGQQMFYTVEDGPGPVSMTLEHWLGLLYVQQASTGVAPPLLGVQPGERVLDLCAAPGGKTMHLAELMGGQGCIVASEVDERRIRGLLGNVYRLGHLNIAVVASDGRTFPEGVKFDRVLVDAPCSGEGTLRKRSGAAPNQSKSFLRYISQLQRQLLHKEVRLTKPGGTVLYVTCTFAPEENEAVVSDILREAPVELEPVNLQVPHAPGLTSFEGEAFDSRLEGAGRIYPHHLDSGGLFIARLKRLGGDPTDESWSQVPKTFPDPQSGEDESRSEKLIEDALLDLVERYGIAPDPEWRWTVRGGRVWLHAVEEWPLSAWEEGPWRPISVGIRAVDFDSRGRARPTNDLLRIANRRIKERVIDLTRSELQSLFHGDPVAVDFPRRGPVALRFEGDVLGRGAVTGEGLKSEIPKARAQDLARLGSIV